MTVLEAVKRLVEVEIEEDIFDDQLLLYVNMGIAYLINNAIPIFEVDKNTSIEEWTEIEENDRKLIIQYLYLDTISQFDRDLAASKATTDYLEARKIENLLQLKCRYEGGRNAK